jgi:AcrR family transcriptional regulator
LYQGNTGAFSTQSLIPQGKIKKESKMGENFVRTGSKDERLVNIRRENIATKTIDIFVKNGYPKTNIRQIAKTCGMSIGNLYHYIGQKDDVLTLVFDYIIHDRIGRFFNETIPAIKAESEIQKLLNIIEKYIRYMHKNQNIVIFLYQETKNFGPNIRKRIYDMEISFINSIKDVLENGCKKGEIEVTDSWLTANNISVMCDMWAFRRWMLRRRYPLEKFISCQKEIVLKMIAKD